MFKWVPLELHLGFLWGFRAFLFLIVSFRVSLGCHLGCHLEFLKGFICGFFGVIFTTSLGFIQVSCRGCYQDFLSGFLQGFFVSPRA